MPQLAGKPIDMENSMNVEALKNRDYYVVIDKSGSMEERDTATGQSRWDYTKESVLAIAKKLNEYDPDGITVVPFAGAYKMYPNTTPEKVTQVFTENSPMGNTILAPPLQACMDDYIQAKTKGEAKANGAIVLVVTDGQPADEEAVVNTIINFTKKLDNGDSEFGISFLQVGKDKHASDFLKRLDDNLEKEGAKFDIVDTKTMDELEGIGLTEALMAALTD